MEDPPVVSVPLSTALEPTTRRGEPPLPWRAAFEHAGGTLRLRVRVELPPRAHPKPPGRVWLSNLRLEPGGAL